MKFGVWVALGAVLAAGAGHAESVEAPSGKAAPVRRDQSTLKEASGTIRAIDKDNNRLIIAPGDKGTPVDLVIDRTTTIFVDGRIGKLDDVLEGNEVRASYELKKGSNRAQWIEVNKRSRR